MKTYQKPDGALWAFEDDGSQDFLITDDMVLLTAEEVEAINNPIVEPQVPQVISKYQGIAQLHNVGLLPSVKSIMANEATDPLVVIAWETVREFRRESPMIAAIAGALGITDEQLDQMFIDAAKLIA